MIILDESPYAKDEMRNMIFYIVDFVAFAIHSMCIKTMYFACILRMSKYSILDDLQSISSKYTTIKRITYAERSVVRFFDEKIKSVGNVISS